jgi:two-component system sensor histidine kinase FlrB
VTILTNRPEDLVATIDAFQVHQALLNLVMNGVDASREGDTVCIGYEELDGPGIALYVENQGHPIRPEVEQQMFEPFFTTKGQGTGLGLAIARNIARAHGGDLTLAVNEPGRVRFVMTLPNARETERKQEYGKDTGGR